MLSAKELKGGVPVFLLQIDPLSVRNCPCRDLPCLCPVPFGAEILEFRFVSEKHFDPSSQIRDRYDSGMHIGGNVEGHGHSRMIKRTCQICKKHLTSGAMPPPNSGPKFCTASSGRGSPIEQHAVTNDTSDQVKKTDVNNPENGNEMPVCGSLVAENRIFCCRNNLSPKEAPGHYPKHSNERMLDET